MKAIVQNGYGSPDHLKVKEVNMAKAKDNEVLVKVHAVGLNAGDIFSLKGSPWLARFSVGFPKPKDYILGWDFAGTVDSVGKDITKFKSGDEVFGSLQHTLSEYICIEENMLVKKPSNFSFEEAATVGTAAITALHGLRNQGNLQAGQSVLINGASGGVGTYAVQIAKALGAEVTGVCSTRNVEMVSSLGADHVVDYTKEDFAAMNKRYDLILDNVASRSISDLKSVLTKDGLIVPNSGHGGMTYVMKALFAGIFSKHVGGLFMANPNQKDLEFLKELIESKKIKTVIDKTFPLEKTSDAFRYLDENHAQGKVVITIG